MEVYIDVWIDDENGEKIKANEAIYTFVAVNKKGRPIKIESNKEAPDFGSANARVHASVLSLYDTERIQLPKIKGEDSSWDSLRSQVLSDLNSVSEKQGKVVLLTQTFASPTTNKIIKELVTKFPNIEQIILDTVPSNYAVESFKDFYGFTGLVDYDFNKSHFIVSVDADFLGDWQGGGYDTKYVSNRVPDKKTCLLYTSDAADE